MYPPPVVQRNRIVVLFDVRYIARDVEALSRSAYVAAWRSTSPCTASRATTTQPTEDASAEGELAEILGAPDVLAETDAPAPNDRKARDGAPMITSIAEGAP